MLATLKKFDRSARNGILASYVETLLPNPGIAEYETRPYPADVYASLRADIQKTLRLKEDESPENRQRILAFLAEQIRVSTIDSKKVKEVRDRVGQKGALPLSSYDVTFSNQFVEKCQSMGVSQALVKQALKAPDSVEHFGAPANVVLAETEPASTIFTKTIRGNDPYVVIVLADRNQSRLKVRGGWVVFHSDVDLSGSSNASEVLRRFVNVFGVSLNIYVDNEAVLANSEESRLILNEERAVSFAPGRNLTLSISNSWVSEEKKAEIIAPHDGFVEAILTYSGLFVRYGFALQLDKYADVLRSHGIRITRVFAKNSSVYFEATQGELARTEP